MIYSGMLDEITLNIKNVFKTRQKKISEEKNSKMITRKANKEIELISFIIHIFQARVKVNRVLDIDHTV